MTLKKIPFSRVLGLALIALSIYMYVADKSYDTSFDTYSRGGKEHHEFTFSFGIVLAIGLVCFFFREFMKYVYKREY